MPTTPITREQVVAALAHWNSPVPAALTSRWHAWLNAESRLSMLILTISGCVAYFTFYFPDAAMYPELAEPSLRLRLVVTPLLGAILLWSVLKVDNPVIRDVVALSSIVIAGVLSLRPFVELAGTVDLSTGYLTSTLCFIVGISIVTSSRFSFAVVASGIMLGALLFTLLEVHHTPKMAALEFFSAFLPVSIFCLQVCWGRLRTTRRAYLRTVLQDIELHKLDHANQELHQQADTDALTGIANRRAFDQVLTAHLARLTAPHARPAALLILDIDYFKNYNDRYGHPTGDECLRKVAHCLRDSLRSRDTRVFRFGGEEFVIIAWDVDTEDALHGLGTRTLHAIEALGIPHEARPDGLGHVTISIGGCLITPSITPPTPREVLERADQCLYQAKHQGRNRLIIRGPMQ